MAAAGADGVEQPVGSMLRKGPRGSGKTVLLAAIRDTAEQHGLTTVRATAKPEPTFADVLIEQLTSVPDTEHRRISSAQLSMLGSGAGVSFRAAIGAATSDMEVQVFAPMVRDVSDTDRLVLEAVSMFDTAEIKLSDIARATGKTSNYLSVYIERLTSQDYVGRVRRADSTSSGPE